MSMAPPFFLRFYALPLSFRRLFLMIAVGAVVMESFWPGSPGTRSAAEVYFFNLAHPFLYGGLALAMLLRLDPGAPLRFTASFAVLGLAGLAGALDEWHQSGVPGRDGTLLDWVADLLGAAAALWLASRLSQKRLPGFWIRFGGFSLLILCWTALVSFGFPLSSSVS
jgi:VanZ family protein